jgi:hypothetical protein
MMAISTQPSPALTAAVFDAMKPALPPSLTYKVEGSHVFALVGRGGSMGVGGISIPRLPLPLRVELTRQVRNLAHALLTTFAPLGDCAAQGARLAVRRSDEGITIQLKDRAEGRVVHTSFLPWAAIDGQSPTPSDPSKK